MKLTRHKTRSAFERYEIVSDRDVAAAADRLDVNVPEKSGAQRPS